MNSNKVKVVACLQRLVSIGLGSVLGLLGCEFSRWTDGPIAAYGMPYADYKLTGTIRAAKTNAPIPGIEIVRSDSAGSMQFLQTAQTDSNGIYTLLFSEYPGVATWRLTAHDVDGDLNGSFAQKDTLVGFPPEALQGSDGTWFKGSADTTIDWTLEKIE